MEKTQAVEKKSVKKTTKKKETVKKKPLKSEIKKEEKNVKKTSAPEVKVDNAKKEDIISKTKELDKAKIVIMICFIFIAALMFVIQKMSIRNENSIKCKYTLTYDDEQNPGAIYEMCISKKKDIIVTRKPKDENEGITIENIRFKDENKKYIDLFMERYIGKKKKVDLKISDIYMWSDEDKVIFQAVLYNDEAFLNTLH